jgi:hypothetical protein
MTCRHHCASCDGHFASLEAFDVHRAGDYATGRFCVDPHECDRLVVATEEGVCRLVGGIAELQGVTVYRSRRHADDTEAVLRLRSADRRDGRSRRGVETARRSEASARAQVGGPW